jgi:hypothetical protein
MKDQQTVEQMREQAYREQFMAKDREDYEAKAYAEGVEAALVWALGHAGNPFPR